MESLYIENTSQEEPFLFLPDQIKSCQKIALDLSISFN